jgi:hypothetical protein
MKEITELKEKPFKSSLKICPEACCKKRRGGGKNNASPHCKKC